MENELFALLRLGLGNTTTENENLSGFIMLPAAQWTRLGEIAQEQGVLGVMLDGIERLEATGYGATRELSKEQKLEWIGNVLNGYEAGNLQQLKVIDAIQRQWYEAGIQMMLMKGQAIGIYYPKPNHRCPGDIDCYLFDDYANGNEQAMKWGGKVDEGWYKHSVIRYKGETIENHQFFVHTREGENSKRFNQVLCKTLKDTKFDTLSGTGVLLPPPLFNALFLTYHAQAHFLEEGLKLKQLLDWAMYLKQDADKVDWSEFYAICDKFHLRRFADIATDIAVHFLGVKLENPLIVTKSPFTAKVIHATLYDKDYIFSSGNSSWANRWHIVKNLFKYRWKYKEVYQHSIAWQLWWYIIGFIFKTE